MSITEDLKDIKLFFAGQSKYSNIDFSGIQETSHDKRRRQELGVEEEEHIPGSRFLTPQNMKALADSEKIYKQK